MSSLENVEEENLIQILHEDEDQDKDKGHGFNAVQLVDEQTAVYQKRNYEIEKQDPEEKISMAGENMENSAPEFGFESETQADREKEPRERSNKIKKIGGILVLCFLLLTFAVVLAAMSWTAKNEDQSSIDPKSLQNCRDAMEILPSPRSAKQTIYPHGNRTSLEVFCDFETDGGGWTIIQKRTSGPKEQFKQNWSNYTQGFGSVSGNFWLGLENIRALRKNGDQELRIEMEDFEGEKRFAKYSNFSISDASDFYRLNIGGFSGSSTLNDSMADNNGQRFLTKDKDNDNWGGGNCALEQGGGGWWFDRCSNSNLNGLYFEKGKYVPSGQGIFWGSWKGWQYSVAKSEMKIRPKK